MITYALDTNIISYYIARNPRIQAKVLEEVEKNNQVIMTPIGYYETLRGLLAIESKRRYAVFMELVDRHGVGVFDNEVLDLAARIYAQNRRKGRPIEDNDVFIAADCILHGYTLVTNNTRHFSYLPQLAIENWYTD